MVVQTDEPMTSTSELTPEEIAIAGGQGKLLVDTSGLGFVPTEWLLALRKRIAQRKEFGVGMSVQVVANDGLQNRQLPASEEIETIVHAFPTGDERRDNIRRLAERVRRLEALAQVSSKDFSECPSSCGHCKFEQETKGVFVCHAHGTDRRAVEARLGPMTDDDWIAWQENKVHKPKVKP